MRDTVHRGKGSFRSGDALARLFELAPEVLCVTGTDGVVRLASPAARTILGVAPETLVGSALGSFVVAEDATLASRLFSNLGPANPTASEVLRFDSGEGVRRIRWSIRLDPSGGACYAVAWDVTQKQRTQTMYHAALQASPSAVLLVDVAGRIALANDAAGRLLRAEPGELIGRDVESFVPEDARPRHPKLRDGFRIHARARPMGQGRDLSVLRSDGKSIPVEIGLAPVALDGQLHVVVSLVDITERNRSEQRIRDLAAKLRHTNESLEKLAVTDPLTGVWNRRKFFEEVERILGVLQEAGGHCSLIILDLDDFKEMNDTFGHPAGDEVLRAVAELLRDTRQGADVVARLGGEEFVVAMPGADRPGAMRLAERLRSSVEAHPWKRRAITASVGVMTLEDAGERGTSTSILVSRMLREADRALYASKEAGKNRVTHAASLEEDPPPS